jgi:hypothetical protein
MGEGMTKINLKVRCPNRIFEIERAGQAAIVEATSAAT